MDLGPGREGSFGARSWLSDLRVVKKKCKKSLKRVDGH